MHDERFPDPDGRYEKDEPIVIAVVPRSQIVDWSSDERTPASSLWIPETLFEAAQEIGRRHSFRILGNIDIYVQHRLDVSEAKKLQKEISRAYDLSENPDLKFCLSLIRQKIEAHTVLGSGYELLLEGP